MSVIKAVLFDMDGLLVDTESLGTKVAVSICKELGLELSSDEQRSFIGVTDEEFYRELFQSRGLDHDVSWVLKKHFAQYEKLLKTDLHAFKGARTLPRFLKRAGYKLALVSGSTRTQIDMVLHALDITNEFECIVSCDDTAQGKPNPEGYIRAARILGVDPRECIVFEDAYTGVCAGKSAGMKVIGIVNAGMQDISSADMIVEDLSIIESNPSSLESLISN